MRKSQLFLIFTVIAMIGSIPHSWYNPDPEPETVFWLKIVAFICGVIAFVISSTLCLVESKLILFMKREDIRFLSELINNDSRVCESEVVRLENDPNALPKRIQQLKERVEENKSLIIRLKSSIFIAKPLG